MFLSPGSRANNKMTALWHAVRKSAVFGNIGNVEKSTDISFNSMGVVIGNVIPLSTAAAAAEHLNLVDIIRANINYMNGSTTRRAAAISFVSDGADGGRLELYTKVSGGVLSQWLAIDNAGNLTTNGPTNVFSGSVTASSNLTASGTVTASSNASVAGSLTLSGSANQFVQGNGTFALQGRKLLNTLTAANSSVLSDTTSLTSAFSDYEIMFTNILPGINNVTPQIQVHSGGAFQTTPYLSTVFQFSAGSPTIATAASSQFLFAGPTGALPTGGQGMSGFLRISNPTSTTAGKIWGGTVWYDGATFAGTSFPSGYWNSVNAIDGFQLTVSSSNIASGTVKIYGIG